MSVVFNASDDRRYKVIARKGLDFIADCSIAASLLLPI